MMPVLCSAQEPENPVITCGRFNGHDGPHISQLSHSDASFIIWGSAAQDAIFAIEVSQPSSGLVIIPKRA